MAAEVAGAGAVAAESVGSGGGVGPGTVSWRRVVAVPFRAVVGELDQTATKYLTE